MHCLLPHIPILDIKQSNSGPWKVVLALPDMLETFQNGLENWRRESCFTRTMLLHISVVAMAAVRDGDFEAVGHPPYFPDLPPSDYLLFPNMRREKKKHLPAKQYRTDVRSYLQLRTFSMIRLTASIPRDSKRCNPDYLEDVCGPQFSLRKSLVRAQPAL